MTIFEQLHPRQSFRSPHEIVLLESRLEELVKDGSIREISLNDRDVFRAFDKVFVELKSGIAFGLTMPDPPYYGNWEEVTADNYRRHIFKQPWNLLDGHNDAPVTEEPLAAQTDIYFAARSSRADIPKALEILHRAGSDNPPIPGDELPS